MADSELGRSTVSGDVKVGADRRSAIRYVRIIQAFLLDNTTQKFGPGWLARILDISPLGIGIHLGDHFPVGTVLTLGLRNPRTERSLPPKKVRVARCDEQSNGTWVAGTEFLTPLSEAELELILE
ncbi:MAG: PilZ domain-containing protein [Gemmataceae bacterium]